MQVKKIKYSNDIIVTKDNKFFYLTQPFNWMDDKYGFIFEEPSLKDFVLIYESYSFNYYRTNTTNCPIYLPVIFNDQFIIFINATYSTISCFLFLEFKIICSKGKPPKFDLFQQKLNDCKSYYINTIKSCYPKINNTIFQRQKNW